MIDKNPCGWARRAPNSQNHTHAMASLQVRLKASRGQQPWDSVRESLARHVLSGEWPGRKAKTRIPQSTFFLWLSGKADHRLLHVERACIRFLDASSTPAEKRPVSISDDDDDGGGGWRKKRRLADRSVLDLKMRAIEDNAKRRLEIEETRLAHTLELLDDWNESDF